MFKALMYKEWLKIRWSLLIMLGVFAVLMLKIALNVAYDIRFYDANKYWYEVVIRGYLFYTDLLYIPALTGIIIGIAQYMPEISASRLKLTLHLPLRENTILLHMVGVGLLVLFVVFAIAEILLTLITLYFFPFEILVSVWITTLPWFLAGFVGYLAAGMVFVEPIWLKRVILILIAYGFMDSLFYAKGFNLYTPSLHLFLLVSLCFVPAIIYTGHRFRKGVM